VDKYHNVEIYRGFRGKTASVFNSSFNEFLGANYIALMAGA